jgi:uncharacterized protein
MNLNSPPCYTAFAGTQLIASGYLGYVVHRALNSAILNSAPVLIFDDVTSNTVEIDLLGTPEYLSHRLAEIEAGTALKNEPSPSDSAARGPGRPKLGVVAREVTLLPRHWDWLAAQPGGASVALRKLVEEARRTNQGKDRLRHAQEAAYRFMSAMAGNEPGFEEAARALFAGNREGFAKITGAWPIDVGNHAKKLAIRAFECSASEQTPQPKPRYTLSELLAKCDYSEPMSPEDREWIDAPPIGRELL